MKIISRKESKALSFWAIEDDQHLPIFDPWSLEFMMIEWAKQIARQEIEELSRPVPGHWLDWAKEDIDKFQEMSA